MKTRHEPDPFKTAERRQADAEADLMRVARGKHSAAIQPPALASTKRAADALLGVAKGKWESGR